MTSGIEFRRLADLELMDSAQATRLRAEAFRRNLDRVAPIAASLRRTLTNPLIDPTAFSMDGWEQLDYHTFWLAVIGKWCHTVILCDGWQYSTGCCKEAGLAIAEGLDIVDQLLRPMSEKAVKALVTSVVQDDSAPLSDTYLRAAQTLLTTNRE